MRTRARLAACAWQPAVRSDARPGTVHGNPDALAQEGRRVDMYEAFQREDRLCCRRMLFGRLAC